MLKGLKIILLIVLSTIVFYFGLNYLRGFNVFNQNNLYYSVFESTNELSTNNPVVVRGLVVGYVLKIIPYKKQLDRFIIVLKLNDDYKIPDNSFVSIKSSIIGSPRLIMTLGNSLTYFKYKDTIPSMYKSSDLETITEHLTPMTAKITRILSTLDTTSLILNNILNPENISHFSNTIAHFSQSAENLNKITQSLNSMVEPNSQLNQTINGLYEFSQLLNKNRDSLNKIIANSTAISQNLKNLNLSQVEANINEGATNLNQILASVKKGQGTLGKLNTDSNLYSNINSLVLSFDSLLIDLKQNPKRYFHISLFNRRNKTKPKPNIQEVPPKKKE